MSVVNSTIKLKVIVIGDSGVGKTSLLERYVKNTFSSNGRYPTIGSDFLKKEIMIESKRVTLHMWDPSGNERITVKSLPLIFYRGTNACILCFDVTDQISFDNLSIWRDSFIDKCNILHYSHLDSFAFVVVGCKVDRVQDRKVSTEQAEAYCQAQNIKYFEVSSKENINVEEVFLFLSHKAFENYTPPNVVVLPDINPPPTVSTYNCC